jgi:hypothetical protein
MSSVRPLLNLPADAARRHNTRFRTGMAPRDELTVTTNEIQSHTGSVLNTPDSTNIPTASR